MPKDIKEIGLPRTTEMDTFNVPGLTLVIDELRCGRFLTNFGFPVDQLAKVTLQPAKIHPTDPTEVPTVVRRMIRTGSSLVVIDPASYADAYKSGAEALLEIGRLPHEGGKPASDTVEGIKLQVEIGKRTHGLLPRETIMRAAKILDDVAEPPAYPAFPTQEQSERAERIKDYNNGLLLQAEEVILDRINVKLNDVLASGLVYLAMYEKLRGLGEIVTLLTHHATDSMDIKSFLNQRSRSFSAKAVDAIAKAKSRQRQYQRLVALVANPEA